MKHFSIEELCRSEIAKAEKIRNNPDSLSKQRLTTLIEKLLDPLRDEYKDEIHISSGYRSFQLNKRAGGVLTSQHLRGEAVDIDNNNRIENEKIYNILLDMDFDQLINEHDFAWVHVSYKDKDRNRHQILAT